jgi:Colicin D
VRGCADVRRCLHALPSTLPSAFSEVVTGPDCCAAIPRIHTYYVMAGNTPILVHNSGETFPSVQSSFKRNSSTLLISTCQATTTLPTLVQDALQAHISHADTIQLRGTYRGNSARFYHNVQSQNVVITDLEGSFVSGWRLSPGQQDNLLVWGQLGGG